ncbi:MAG: glycosyltransferase family 4 protein [Candidatus Paceibacterota bacterium]
MKKILVINKYCPLHPKAGGAEVRLKDIFSRIGKNHKVYLLTAMFPGAKRKETYENINIIRLGKTDSENTIRIHFLIVLLIRKYLKKIKPDVLYEDISVLPFFTPILCPSQEKVVIIHHLNKRDFFKSQRLIFALIGYLAEISFLFTYKKQKVIVVSEWMKDELEKKNFKDVTKILNGTSKKLFSDKKYNKNPTVLFLGRLEKRKGIDLFLKTYPLVIKRVSNVNYIVAGEEFKFKRKGFSLEKLKEKYKNIQFLGYVTEEKKKQLLESCWLYVAPSIIEGYGISVLEANSTGTFVIGNKVKGLNESIKDKKTGQLIDCYNTKIFAKTIINWLDKNKLKEKEENCKKWAKKHDWDKAALETEKLII